MYGVQSLGLKKYQMSFSNSLGKLGLDEMGRTLLNSSVYLTSQFKYSQRENCCKNTKLSEVKMSSLKCWLAKSVTQLVMFTVWLLSAGQLSADVHVTQPLNNEYIHEQQSEADVSLW